MNDFTKEELKALKNLVIYVLRGFSDLPVNSIYQGLHNKLQSIIDNYCEHVPSDNGMFLSKVYYICTKCGGHFE